MNIFASIVNCDASAIIMGVLTLLVALFFWHNRKPKNFPSGPNGLPFVGYAPFIGENAGQTFMDMKKKYGPMVSVPVGGDRWIVLNDFATINEALVKQGDKFSGRPQSFMFENFSKGYGVATADYGERWKSLRKFGLKTLRGFGVGKKSMEDNVKEEAAVLLENLTMKSNESLRMKVSLAVSNVISRVVFGSRLTKDDKKFKKMMQVLTEFTADTSNTKLLSAIFLAPKLRYIPPFRGAFGQALENYSGLLDILRNFMLDHKATLDVKEPRDFIDAFLVEINERGDQSDIFNEKQLLQYIEDLFDAGTGTTSSTLLWMILCLAHFPESQDKIYKEVDAVVGGSGSLSMKHRDEMPYTCAFIQEIMRVKTLVPLSVFHSASVDTVLHGYSIPKNTIIIPNLWSVHYDPDLFENPKEFRPERFIDGDGKFVSSNHVIPFSVGPRHCLGEQLARMEIFIFLTSIVQKLRIVADGDNPLPPFLKYATNPMFNDCTDYSVIFQNR